MRSCAYNIVISAILTLGFSLTQVAVAGDGSPLRLGVAGLSHGHLGEVAAKADRGDFVIVGVAESDDHVRANNWWVPQLDPGIVYADLGTMLDETRPEAVIAYGSIYDHLAVVEECAPRGIHVMVEKPLAVSGEHARRMAELAGQYGIYILTNYETTWYGANRVIQEILERDGIGRLTRINVYDGHQGPVEIGCGPEFFAWLTDPVLNGGGAVIDFGCYGADLATCIMQGQRPRSVYAVLKQLKPEVYPRVDDDATIVLEYDDVMVQIMASWAWPMNRKDMHIYGHRGYIYQDTATELRVMEDGREKHIIADPLPAPFDDPFHLLRAVVRGEVSPEASHLSALETNLTVVEILDAARESALSGQKITLR